MFKCPTPLDSHHSWNKKMFNSKLHFLPQKFLSRTQNYLSTIHISYILFNISQALLFFYLGSFLSDMKLKSFFIYRKQNEYVEYQFEEGKLKPWCDTLDLSNQIVWTWWKRIQECYQPENYQPMCTVCTTIKFPGLLFVEL